MSISEHAVSTASSAASRLLLLLGCLLLTVPCRPQSGVLLGMATPQISDLQDFGSIVAPKYRTLWVAPDASGQLKVLATLPELIVPRRDGFWHVGVKQVCEFESANESLRQVVWAAPVGKPGTVEQTQPCTPHKPDDYAGPYLRTEEDKDKISQCGFQLLNVEYLSPEIASITEYGSQSEDCEPRGGHYSEVHYVLKLDSNQAVKFGQLLGEKASAAYAQALPDHAKNDMGVEDCGAPDSDEDVGWRIAHKLGRWRPYLNQSLGMFGCSVDAPIAFPLPTSLTGDPSKPLDWKPLRTKIAGIEDAYLSPGGDLLIAVFHAELKFFEAHGGVPEKLLLTLPAGQIVMAQWAQGKHVADWTAEMDRIAKQPPLAPVVKVKPAAH